VSREKLSRRQFFKAAAMSAAGAAIVACQPQTVVVKETVEVEKEVTKIVAGTPIVETVVVEKEVTVETVATAAPAPAEYAALSDMPPSTSREAPMLAERVSTGELPPVEERLAAEPLVVQPMQIGKYGGTRRNGHVSSNIWITDGQVEYEGFLRINADQVSWEPNLCKGVDVSADASTYTLSLRKGVKWSDGEPLTAQDFVFWYRDILQNKEITPSIDTRFTPGGEVFELTAPDDFTLVIKFAVPYPAFLMASLAHRYGFWSGPFVPAHYLKQFHVDYNANAVDEAKAENYDTWYARFKDKQSSQSNVDLPTLQMAMPVSNDASLAVLQRNPYYWIVDTEGNQMPYIDNYEVLHLTDWEVYQAKVITGEFTTAVMDTSILNYASYEAAAEDADYRITLWESGKGGEVYYQVNMTYNKDPVLRDIFGDVRFRRAMSLAIDRDEVNRLIYFGQAIPRQMTVIRQTSWFKPEYETAWAEYDLGQANALLDEMGLEWDANKTWRLRPDGEPIQIVFDFFETDTPKLPITELLAEFWKAVGVELIYTSAAASLVSERCTANEEPMSLWHGDAASEILFPLDRKWILGKPEGQEGVGALLWNRWLDAVSQGKDPPEESEEPPQWWKDHYDNYYKFASTLDPELAAKVLEFQADQILSIGIVGQAPQPFIIRNNLRNIPDFGIWNWDDLFSYPYHAETYFFE